MQLKCIYKLFAVNVNLIQGPLVHRVMPSANTDLSGLLEAGIEPDCTVPIEWTTVLTNFKEGN